MDKMVLTGLDKNIISDIEQAVANACAKHPIFATSTHEVVSLATEELGEFAQAVNDRNPELAKKEALDLIAVIVRYLQEEKNKMKENRIYCTEVSGECQHLMDTTSPLSAYLCQCLPGFYCNKDIAWKPITENACKNCKEGRYQGFTREQAIEKMAKAIFTQIWGLPNNRFDLAKSSVKVRNRKLAEAALNALLEGNYDER